MLCGGVLLVRIGALRSSRQRPLWLTLLAFSLGVLALQKPVVQGINSLSGIKNFNYLVSGVLGVAFVTGVFNFACKLSASHSPERAPWRRSRTWAAVLTVAAMIVIFCLVARSGVPTGDRMLPTRRSLSVLSLYWAVYLGYMLTISIWSTFLFWRQLPRTSSRPLRLAVILLAAGSSAMDLFLVSRLVALLFNSHALVTVGFVVSTVNFIFFSLGCSTAAFLPAIFGLQAWRNCVTLYPLWKMLYDAVPHIALQAPHSRIIDALTIRNSQFRLQRRMIEIRDGFLTLRDWVTESDLSMISESMDRIDIDEDSREIVKTAVGVKVAIHRKENGLPRSNSAVDLVVDGGSDAQTELQWLRDVSDAWKSKLVEECSESVTAGLSHFADQHHRSRR